MTQSQEHITEHLATAENRDGAHIIVFGNEKGGSGKSTSAMHTAIALMRLGYRVGTIDVDARQGTLTRYIKNRWDYCAREHHDLPCPVHMPVEKSSLDSKSAAEDEEKEFLRLAISELSRVHDFIVIDTPGTDSHLSRIAHSYADTVVTPLNDSFLDLDLIGRIDSTSSEIKGPSVYTKMLKEQREKRQAMRWIVMRNRVSHINANNKKRVGDLLDEMAALYDFKIAPGFGERVIFRELFLNGLTLLDLKKSSGSLSMSEISARMEVRQLVMAIAPETYKGHRKPPAS